MKQIMSVLGILICFSCTKHTITPIETHAEIVHYQSTIQDIIMQNCFTCHGANSSVPMYDYNSVVLLAQSGQLKGALLSDSITNPDALYLHMPPFNALDSLSLSLLIKWIDQDCPE